jgi:hypothetical protein
MDQALLLLAISALRVAAELKAVVGKRTKTLKRKPSTAPMSMTIVGMSTIDVGMSIIAKNVP